MTRQSHLRNRSSRRRRGFTLVEVLLVLAILGVIAAMVVPNLLGRQQEAMRKASANNVKGLEDACTLYATSNDGEYPPNLAALMNPGVDSTGKPVAPYLTKEPKDAWGIPLNYTFESGAPKPRIWSNGPNKQNDNGSGDDIGNWN